MIQEKRLFQIAYIQGVKLINCVSKFNCFFGIDKSVTFLGVVGIGDILRIVQAKSFPRNYAVDLSTKGERERKGKLNHKKKVLLGMIK